MISADITAVLNKREADMQKLKNYLDAGKTQDEGIVKSVIKKIERAERTLIDNGYTDFTKLNINDLISNDREESAVTEENDKSIEKSNKEECKENNKSRKSSKVTPKREMIFEKAARTTKLGVGIKKNTLKKIEGLLPSKSSSEKANVNTIVVRLLEEVYKDGKFTVEFDKKDDYKVTSYMIPENIERAITKVHKETKLPKSEIFNKLLEEALKSYYD